MTKDDIGGTRGSEMEGDEVDGEGEYISEHSPEYRKMGSLELGGGLEVIRPQMTWGALKQDKRVLNGHGEVMPHEESAKA